MKTIIKIVSSGLCLGYIPVMPGTFGSIIGVLVYLQLHDSRPLLILATLQLFLLGLLTASRAQSIFCKKDSPKIVIDEIASMCLVLVFVRYSAFMVILAFILFRIYDITKPPPAKRLAMLPASAGIMLDDLVAALYAIISLGVFNGARYLVLGRGF